MKADRIVHSMALRTFERPPVRSHVSLTPVEPYTCTNALRRGIVTAMIMRRLLANPSPERRRRAASMAALWNNMGIAVVCVSSVGAVALLASHLAPGAFDAVNAENTRRWLAHVSPAFLGVFLAGALTIYGGLAVRRRGVISQTQNMLMQADFSGKLKEHQNLVRIADHHRHIFGQVVPGTPEATWLTSAEVVLGHCQRIAIGIQNGELDESTIHDEQRWEVCQMVRLLKPFIEGTNPAAIPNRDYGGY